jgi:general secretion pathway protein J
MKNSGFTLVEVLVSIFIFAILATGSYQVLQSAVQTDEVSGRRIDRLAAIQKTFMIVDRDFSQMAHRNNRYPSQGVRRYVWAAKNILNSDDWGIEFVRNSLLNPGAMLNRSELQRVAYRLKDGELQRGTYDRQDPIEDRPPAWETLITGVSRFELKFKNARNAKDWSEFAREGTVPAGVLFSITLDDYGKIQRVSMVLRDE